MFKLLKDKLKSFFGVEKKEEKAKKPKKAKEKKIVSKEKKIKPSKKKANTKAIVAEKQIEQEKTLKEEEKLEAKVAENEIEAEIKELQEETKETQEQEEPQEIEKVEKKGFFSNIISKFTTSKIEKEQVEQLFENLEIILLEHNVALEVVDKIKSNLINSLVGQQVKSKEIKDKVIESIKTSLESVLTDAPNLIEEIKNHQGTYTILFFGINGTGKTTTIAKIAHQLKKQNISVVLAAADTFRAAAIEQLEIHANKLNVPIIKSQYSADPTSVAFEAKAYAEKHKIKCLLIDTAGRMYTKENLIKQMEKLIRVIKPNKKIFEGESTTGNDIIEQIKTFDEALGIDGIILSKADIDEKGGTALSVSYITKKPIYFLGTGQTYDDLK
ncbi:MAG: signal recognition particle-docking protein FtsY, partial [Nanoarchaeota archaeon]